MAGGHLRHPEHKADTGPAERLVGSPRSALPCSSGAPASGDHVGQQPPFFRTAARRLASTPRPRDRPRDIRAICVEAACAPERAHRTSSSCSSARKSVPPASGNPDAGRRSAAGTSSTVTRSPTHNSPAAKRCRIRSRIGSAIREELRSVFNHIRKIGYDSIPWNASACCFFAPATRLVRRSPKRS